MSENKYGEPWKYDHERNGAVVHREDLPVCYSSHIEMTRLVERIVPCVNFCAGVDVPNKVGGLKALEAKRLRTGKLLRKIKKCLIAREGFDGEDKLIPLISAALKEQE